MRFIIDNGYLEYDNIGKGTPLLLIHGYPLSRKIWTPQLIGLADIASMISVDLRGHGDSYPFEGPYPMDLLADDCLKLLDGLKVNTPCVICGLSMGGYVTMALYRNYPDIFKGIILTSTRPGSDSIEAKASRNIAIRNALEYGASSIAKNILPKLVSPYTLSNNPDLINIVQNIISNTSINGIVGALHGMRDRPDSLSLLNQIKCPVLIIHGKDDQIIPVKEVEIMDEQIPDSRLIIINSAGHLPNLEQPNQFNNAVKNFLLSLD
jgi:pimeloyl-ACP methyl ester carboxylesterase